MARLLITLSRIIFSVLLASSLCLIPALLRIRAADIPVPPSEHPRVFLRAGDVSGLRLKRETDLLRPVWEKLVAFARSDNVTTGSIRCNAMLYLLDGDRSAGIKAVEDLNQMLVSFHSENTRAIGDVLTAGAIVYDWCYDLVADERKHDFIRHFETMAARMEVGYPPVKQGVITGHGAESQVLRDQLACGLAIYDQKPEMYQQAAGRIVRQHKPALEFVYRAHMAHAGDSYGSYRFQWDLNAAFIFRRMGAGDLLSADQGQVPYHWLYVRRPDGSYLRAGDTFEDEQHSDQYWEHYEPNCLVAAYYQDEYIQGEFLRQYAGADGPGSKAAGRDPVFEILFVDSNLKGSSVADLPLSRYFGASGASDDSPLSTMVARTGWTEGIDLTSADVVADMRINTYQYNGHHHLDSGAFQIYYKGALAIDSGIYRIYETDHHMNYSRRTIAHNCVLVHDPAEQFQYHESTNPTLFRGQRVQIENDGGQTWPNSGYEPYDLDQLQDSAKGYKRAVVLGHEIGPDSLRPEFTYLKGDLKAAYSDKVEEYTRSFVFLNLKNREHPAALIVYDHVVSSDPSFKKAWLLHSIEEPLVEGHQSTIRRTGSTAFGKYNGQLVNSTLLPARATVEKVGGPGREFFVFGKNHPLGEWDVLTLTESAEPGAWRIEVSPAAPSAADSFLNVMQVMDNGTLPFRVVPFDSPLMTGASIGGRVVLLGKSGDRISHPVSFQVNGRGEMQFAVTDLAAGIWAVSGKNRQLVRVTEEGGVAFFTGSAGKYTISRPR